MATVRVKPDIACVVEDTPNGGALHLAPGMAFQDDDWIVRTYWWAFAYDNGSAVPDPSEGRRGRKVEQATAAPGELR